MSAIASFSTFAFWGVWSTIPNPFLGGSGTPHTSVPTCRFWETHARPKVAKLQGERCAGLRRNFKKFRRCVALRCVALRCVALRCVALRSFVRARASWFLAVRNQKVKFCHEKITFKFLWGSLEYHVYSCFWYFTEAVLLQNRHIGAFNVADYKALGRPFSANQALLKGWNWKSTSKLRKSADLRHFWRLRLKTHLWSLDTLLHHSG